MEIKTLKCPVCGISIVPQGMSNHILGSARQEVYKIYTNKSKIKSKHQLFVDEHTVDKKKFHWRKHPNK